MPESPGVLCPGDMAPRFCQLASSLVNQQHQRQQQHEHCHHALRFISTNPHVSGSHSPRTRQSQAFGRISQNFLHGGELARATSGRVAVAVGGFFGGIDAIFRTPSSWTSGAQFQRSFWSPRWPTVTWKALRRTRKNVCVGQRSKATPDQTREEDSVQDGNFVPFVVPGVSSNSCTSSSSTSPPQDSSSTTSSPATERSHDGAQGNWCDTPKTQKKRETTMDHRDCDTVQNGARSSQKISKIQMCLHLHTFFSRLQSQNGLQVASRKHSIFTHFPKDRNGEVCLRSKMTRAPCRRRTGETVPRSEKLGDLRPADHKVFNEEGESRNNHRYNSQEFGRSCEVLSWNHGTSTPHRSETHVISESGTRKKRRNVCCTVAIRLG